MRLLAFDIGPFLMPALAAGFLLGFLWDRYDKWNRDGGWRYTPLICFGAVIWVILGIIALL